MHWLPANTTRPSSPPLPTDEVSTGLDSSTTADTITLLRTVVTVMQGTAIASLLQPPPEVFAMFDNVMLMREGRIVYHGPRALVLR